MSGFAKTKKLVGAMQDGAQKELLTNLIRKAEFIHGELLKLQDIILEKGWVEEYQNGQNQHGVKKSSEGDTYNQLIKNYTSLMRQIMDKLPMQTGEPDEFERYMKEQGR